MNYNLRRMREPNVYLDPEKADCEVIGKVRHWIDYDGSHLFSDCNHIEPRDGNGYFFEHVRISPEGHVTVGKDPTKGLYDWLNKRHLLEKLAINWPQYPVDEDSMIQKLTTWILKPRLHERLKQERLESDYDSTRSIMHVYTAVSMLAGYREMDRAMDAMEIRGLAKKLASAMDFATLAVLSDSVEAARRFVSQVDSTSKAIEKGIRLAAEQRQALPSGDDVWVHSGLKLTRPGFDKALVSSGFGWLPRESSRNFKLSFEG